MSRYQHFPQNMVDGVLGAVIDELGSLLARGYIVELGELGHLSVSLKCTQKVMTKKKSVPNLSVLTMYTCVPPKILN